MAPATSAIFGSGPNDECGVDGRYLEFDGAQQRVDADLVLIMATANLTLIADEDLLSAASRSGRNEEGVEPRRRSSLISKEPED